MKVCRLPQVTLFSRHSPLWRQVAGCYPLGSVRMTGAMGSTASFRHYGRNAVSGTYGFFKDNALCGGDFQVQRQRSRPGFFFGSTGRDESSTVSATPASATAPSGVRIVPLAG